MFNWFRRNASEAVIDRLHGEIMAAARQPALYTAYGVADTVSGRFEMVALHAALAARRLEALTPKGPELAQALVDAVFRHFDVALREIGVGDLTVPKKMIAFAESYLGRAKAYGAALDAAAPDDPSLAQALARNVYGLETGPDAHAQRLARYVRALERALAGADLTAFERGPAPAVDAAGLA